jgi:hypothetical protein
LDLFGHGNGNGEEREDELGDLHVVGSFEWMLSVILVFRKIVSQTLFCFRFIWRLGCYDKNIRV